MAKKYAAAVDQGTTSTRFMIFDHEGQVVGLHQMEHEQIYPQAGWIEHNPMEIWDRTQDVIKAALDKSGIDAIEITAIGVTNQRETTVVWDKNTGKPYYNAIVWQCTRTKDICDDLAKAGGQERFRSKVGLPLATYFSGPKIKWILDNVKGVAHFPRVRWIMRSGELASRSYSWKWSQVVAWRGRTCLTPCLLYSRIQCIIMGNSESLE